jgi:tetratricopeptide (TPR) repeat protein
MKEALHFAREAVLMNDSNLDYQKRLAYLYIDSGRFDESLVALKKLVDTEPTRFYNWYAYAEVLMLTGDFDEAVVVLNNATKLHNRAEIFYQLSNCYFHINNPKSGRSALAKALKLDPQLLEDMKQKYPFLREEAEREKTKKK